MSEPSDPAIDQTGVTFVATRRNGRALCFGGFFYHINKSVDERSYWKCRTKGCKATVVTINDVIHSSSSQHYHQPNDSRVLANGQPSALSNASQNCLVRRPKVSITSQLVPLSQSQNSFSGKHRINEKANHLPNKRLKSNNFRNGFRCVDNEEDMIRSLEDHLNVQFEVDESGKVKFEDTDDNEDLDSDEMFAGEGSAQSGTRLIPNIDIKPNNIYYTNNYTNIDNFDIELNNLFEVVRQTGFNSLDIEQISSDWDLWKNRYVELKRATKSAIHSNSNGTDDNLKLKLDIALNAKSNADKELKRCQSHLKESQSTVSMLRAVLKRNLLNASNSHCISLINEIHELKRKVCAHVESHQSNLNDIKRLLSLDDNELRAEFDQLAQERDEALKDNFELKREIIILKSQLSSYEDKSE